MRTALEVNGFAKESAPRIMIDNGSARNYIKEEIVLKK